MYSLKIKIKEMRIESGTEYEKGWPCSEKYGKGDNIFLIKKYTNEPFSFFLLEPQASIDSRYHITRGKPKF